MGTAGASVDDDRRSIHELARRFAGAFPLLSVPDQHLALALYRRLARGRAVEPAALAAAAGREPGEVEALLSGWPGLFRDDAGRITAFLGLSTAETVHRFEVDGSTLFTWCAWDALFLPRLLGATAQVVSACPVTGTPVHLTVAPHGVESVHPHETVVSFLMPAEEELRRHTTASFCHFVHFFASPPAAGEWLAQHPEAWTLDLAEAFALGAAVNEARYPDALGVSPAPDSRASP